MKTNSAKLFPKRVACRNLRNQASHQLLGEQSRQWGCRGQRLQGLGHLLRHLGGSEGQMAVLPEDTRWQRRIQLFSSPVPLVLSSTCYVLFSRDSSVAPPWGRKASRDTQQIPVSFLCSVTAASCHCHLLDKVPGFHSHLHKFWSSKGYFKRSFFLIYTWKGLDTPLYHKEVFSKISS